MPSVIGYVKLNSERVVSSGEVIFHNAENKTAGDFIKEVYYGLSIDYPKFFKMDLLSKLGFLAGEILLQKCRFDRDKDGRNTGIILFNSTSSLETDINFQHTIRSDSEFFPSPAVFVYTLPNIMIGEICIRHQITGQNVFFVTETFDPEFCITFVNEIFANTATDKLLVGWVDSLEGNKIASMMYLSKVDKGDDFSLQYLRSFSELIEKG